MSEEVDIRWGTPSKFGRNRYESFFSDGTEYWTYDNVQVFDENSAEPHIGKIIKLWEDDDGVKLVLIRWYLKREDILPFNPSEDPREVYLAFGKGKGVSNINELEVICSKCKVLCCSKDKLNPEPSEADLEAADFYFKSIFNVDKQCISPVERIPEKLRPTIAYNKPEWVTGSTTSVDAKDKKHPIMHELDGCPTGAQTSPRESVVGNAKSFIVKDDEILKKTTRTEYGAGEQLMPAEPEPDKEDAGLPKKGIAAENFKLFKPLPWDDNLEHGIKEGKVLLLQNLDMMITSEDVREIMKSEFVGFSDAKVLPQIIRCPSAQALVIFNTQHNADKALEELDQSCLVLTDQRRPIIAGKFIREESSTLTKLHGHLEIEKLMSSRILPTENQKRVVATSHCSQPNTIEYEMAMEWVHLNDISKDCRTKVFERQKKEYEDLKRVSYRKEEPKRAKY